MKDNWKKVEKISSSLADGMRGCLFVFVFQGGGGGGMKTDGFDRKR